MVSLAPISSLGGPSELELEELPKPSPNHRSQNLSGLGVWMDGMICICMYIYIYTYTYIYIYIYIHTHMYICIHTLYVDIFWVRG